MQPVEAANDAFKDHKPAGSDISANAAMIMLDHAMNEMNKADCRTAQPLATADHISHALEKQLAAYGVTALIICDNNNNGVFDKNDDVAVVKGQKSEILKYSPQQHDHQKELNFNSDQKQAVQNLEKGNFGEWFKSSTGNMSSTEQQEKFVKDVMTALKDTGHKVDYSYSRHTGIVDLKVDGNRYTTHIGY